ncbi:malonyl-ACP O-methyltransferase BioC [bacterium]|nr:malonyl-ACP O-methyltransferase BioC [bacterium]
MQTDPKTIKKQFRKSIGKYDENAVVQNIIAERIAKILSEYEFENVLEIGAGSGLLTAQIAKHIRYNEYYANDLVEKSEVYVKKYIPNVKFFSGDFRKIKFNQKFDLVVSNAVFQWYENLDKIFEQCKNLLNPNGVLAFSTFSPDNFREIKAITGLSLEYKTEKEIISVLKKDFEIITSETTEHKMTFDNPLKILAHMKNTGVNSLSDTKWGVKEVKDFCDKYKTQFPDLTLTYAPIIIAAKKI